MTANLFGERFVGVRAPGWHQLGRVYADAPEIVKALVDNDLDYKISLRPLFAEASNHLELQDLVPIDNRCAIMREPTRDDQKWQFLGIASEGYSIVQNIDIARLVKPLTDLWPLETIGALGKGETLFISLKAPATSVAGEEIEQYFLITDTRDGGTSLKIAFTPVRVVCQNTLVSGLSQATVSTALQHTGEIVNDLRLRVGLLQKMHRAMGDTIETFQHLADKGVNSEAVKRIIAAAYPDPKMPANAMLLDPATGANSREELGDLFDVASSAVASFEYYCNRARMQRDAVYTLYGRLCDEHRGIAGTAWAAYNAVVEFADYREGNNDTAIAVSSLFGYRATEKKRAFQMALRA